MKEEHDIEEMYTRVSLGNEVAGHLYKSVGFQVTGLVENVVTHADYHNRGYAVALLEKATEIAKGRGVTKCSSKRVPTKEAL